MTDAYSRVIPEDALEGRRLGRHVLHDPRSKDYPATTAATIKSVKHESQGLPFDQGSLGSCTANALCGALNSAPDSAKELKIFSEADAKRVYGIETALEGEPWPPNDPGGTGLMVCKAGEQLGIVKHYRHAFGLVHALRALVIRPVIFGFDWYDGFDSPDRDGLVQLTGSVRGGHEVCATEIDADRRLVGFWNSWGPDWGLGGRFYMSWDTVAALLQAYGDATVPYP